MTLGHLRYKTAQWKLGVGNRCLENNLLIVKKKNEVFEWRHVKAFSSLELSELWLLKHSLACSHANCILEDKSTSDFPSSWWKAHAQPAESPQAWGGEPMKTGTPKNLLTPVQRGCHRKRVNSILCSFSHWGLYVHWFFLMLNQNLSFWKV